VLDVLGKITERRAQLVGALLSVAGPTIVVRNDLDRLIEVVVSDVAHDAIVALAAAMSTWAGLKLTKPC
jgi:hypothetical protein